SRAAGRKANSARLPRTRRNEPTRFIVKFAIAAVLTGFMNPCLQAVQRCIAAAGLDQRLMGAVFDQAAAFERDDTIGRTYRGESVRDDQNRPPFGDLLHIVLDDPFTLVIERACGLVENQNAWVGDECACNGDTLTLTARKRGAALPDNRVI